MEGFEILILALFLLFPLLEGVLEKRRKGGTEAPPPPGPETAGDGPGDAGSATSEDILPEELWKELLGVPDRTSTAPVEREPEPSFEPAGDAAEEAGSDDGWISEPPGRQTTGEGGLGEEAVPATVAGEPDEAAAEREALRREIAAGRSRPGAGRSRSGELQGVRPGRLARRGAAPVEGGHPLVGDVDDEALRRAVVWKEVLGPPRARRRRGGKE